MDNFSEYAVPSPEFLELAKNFPPPVPDNDDPILMRQGTVALVAGMNPSYTGLSDCDFKDSTIAIEGADIPIRIYTPKDHSASSPLIVYFHPGGWVIGDLELGHPNCLTFASHGAVVISVLYRKAPENPYPIPQTDCYNAFEKILETKPVDFDANRVYVFGASAGGQLCIYTAIRDIEAGKNRIKGMLLHAPVTCWAPAFPEGLISGEKSFDQNAKAPILGAYEMHRFTRMLGATEEELKSPYLSPLLATQFHGKMPKTYVQTYGLDPLRDEGILFAKKIVEAGGEAKWDCYSGFPHCAFQVFWMLPTTTKSLKDLTDAARDMGAVN